MIETWPGFLAVWGATFPAGNFESRAQSPRANPERGFRVCAAGSPTPPPALLGSNSGIQKTASVYTDSSRYLSYSYISVFSLLWLLIICLLTPALQGTFIPLTAPISSSRPLTYSSHNELLYLHYIPILLHQPSGEAPARLETRGWGGEVGGKGCGLSSEETKEEEGGNGGAREGAQLPWTAQWVSLCYTYSKSQVQWSGPIQGGIGDLQNRTVFRLFVLLQCFYLSGTIKDKE